MTFESGDSSSMDSVRGGIFQIRLEGCLMKLLATRSTLSLLIIFEVVEGWDRAAEDRHRRERKHL
jgi:hypothetical protein